MTDPTTTDNALAKKALKKIRALCTGNGIDPQQVRIDQFRQQEINFTGETLISLKPQTEEKTLPGRYTDGYVVNSRSEIEQTVEQTVQNISNDSSTHKQIVKFIIARPDKGFFMDDKQFDVDIPAHKFICHENCHQCGGQGKTTCGQCNGSGRETCPKCRGRLSVPCNHCGGSGTIQGNNGPITCPHCQGRGQITCDLCRGSGSVTCGRCGGSGFNTCSACQGHGIFSHITELNIQAQAGFNYQRDTIPESAISTINQLASRLIPKGHIQALAEQGDNEGGKISVLYRAKFPYGKIIFALNNRKVPANIFGYNVRLANLPPFLEKLVAPGIKNLEQAAKGQGSVAQKIKKASQYRLLGFALLKASILNARETAKKIKKKFPYGLKTATINRIAKAADLAAANITRRPKIIGFFSGLVLSSLLYAFYFLGGGRLAVAQNITGNSLTPIIDFSFLLIGIFLSNFITRLSTARAMQTALGHLLPPEKKKKLRSKIGKASLWNSICIAVIFLIFVELTMHFNITTPSWYLQIRNIIPL